ncbi:ATP-binding cassette, subfamily C (CFTR/MRP), member 1 [Entomortierella parvispora]|uniref:ATP-binding cassette, subfamily C (CFTR/MRP), member 1 n=1 Tax=Entomortierella parvispora TaxID=205924 RepID=A0A9P3LUQ5_9FUNG|nr:ATP-binding cassette, subfamily C (CFTR/MRP), member 1 [Entomortierella parvispora]
MGTHERHKDRPHPLLRGHHPTWTARIGSRAIVRDPGMIIQLKQSDAAPSALFATSTLFISWVFALVQGYLQAKLEIRSSSIIYGFYAYCIMASIIVIRTMHDMGLSGQGQFISFCVFFGSLIFGFVAEAWPRQSGVRGEKGTFDEANLFSRMTFHFVQDIFSKGSRQPLQEQDIAERMPRRIQTKYSYSHLARLWDQHVLHCQQKNKEPSLFWVTVISCGWGWMPVTLFSFLQSIMEYSQVLLLTVLLDFIAETTEASSTIATADQTLTQHHPMVYGLILSFGMFLATFMSTLAAGQFFQGCANLGIELKAGLVGMVFAKSLRLSPGARQRSTVGEISTHMSVDVERIAFAMTAFPMIVTSVFEICVGMWLLYRQMGPSSLTGVGVVILIFPVQAWTAKWLSKARDQKLASMDRRVRVLTEVLSAMKTVKMYCWEDSFREKITQLRKTELSFLRKIGIAWALMCIMFTSLPLVMSLLTFTVYSLWGGPGGTRGPITPQLVFICVTLFARLGQPIGRVSGLANTVINMNVAVKRIQVLLLEDELDQDWIGQPSSSRKSPEDGPAIEVEDGTFTWTSEIDVEKKKKADAIAAAKVAKAAKSAETEVAQPDRPATDPAAVTDAKEATDSSPLLKGINLKIDHGSLTMVVGRVGQGKSSLIAAIIGEMYKLQGRVAVRGSLAYCPQSSWIINASVKDNILFGKPMDQERYNRVLDCCNLLPDLALFPANDDTEIGERGINLSGGQKQRVSLARAAYQDADIYIMDDPLSAVDAHVDQHLWRQLIGPDGLLKDKTRLLVTHGIHHLADADQILVIKDGEIVETGQYKDLLEAKLGFYQLIMDYPVQQQEKEATEGEDVDATIVEDESADRSVLDLTLVKEEENGQLIQAEEAAIGSVGWAVFHRYVKSASYIYSFLSLFLYTMSQASQIGINVWLQNWSNRQQLQEPASVGELLGVFAALVVSYMILDTSVNLIIFIKAGVHASKVMHNNLLTKILRLPIAFFDTTPVGRIVNRFSTDVDNLDEEMPTNITNIYYFLTTVVGTLVVISFTLPIFLALVPFLAIIYFWIQTYYMRTSRALKRIHSISKSPLYQHFQETLAGVSTIRAMGLQSRYVIESAEKSDRSSNAHYHLLVANRWLNIRLEFLGALIVLATSLLSVSKRDELGTGKAGLALSYALTVTFTITYLVQALGSLQNQLVSVERIQEYCDKNPEAPMTVADGNKRGDEKKAEMHTALSDAAPPQLHLPPTPQWPEYGRITFKNYSTRYREGMDLVLRDVSFEVQPGESVGIVGRTGAGKSSLTLALFRIVEAADSYWARASHNKTDSSQLEDTSTEELKDIKIGSLTGDLGGGSIELDGVDISTLGLKDLRSRLAIIPQDPTLFAGTVRENLDPFQECDDSELWTALERAHLKTKISSLSGALSFEVSQGGDNFSVGERSLICLARALLRKTKILVLDEATAAVDMETDELIQKTIREEFKDRTVLTIAHRIKTVMDSDKILVMEKGCVEEFDHPELLLRNKDSLFRKLVEQAGELPKDLF